jgi:hypothetical protein
MTRLVSQHATLKVLRGSVTPRAWGRLLFGLCLTLLFVAQSASAADRVIDTVALSQDGALLVTYVEDDGYLRSTTPAFGDLAASSTSTGKVLWSIRQHDQVSSLAISPDKRVIAVGYRNMDETKDGVEFLDASTGKQMGTVPNDSQQHFYPGQSFPSWSGGVAQLVYSSDGTLLYGLSTDGLFAWSLSSHSLLWKKAVPGGEAINSVDHPSTFSVSPDGKQIAVVRLSDVYVMTAGPSAPKLVVKRAGGLTMAGPSRAVFSPDSKSLAAGEQLSTKRYATRVWAQGRARPIDIPDCGGGVAWQADGKAIACQNNQSTSLRALDAPTTTIGAPAPASDLPVLQVGSSLWVAAYRSSDWQQPTQPLALKLIELQPNGKQITVSLPARTTAR